MLQTPDFCFRSFRLDAANERLWRGSREITLRPKTFAVLRYLVTHAGRLITKDELLDAVWPDTSVSDVVPIVCVRELRQALGDHPEAPRYIETVPRRGYRFIAPITTATAPMQKAKGKNQKAKGQILSSLDAGPRTLDSRLSSAHLLVGRETELTHLHRLLEKACGGERQIVFISGEAGIGKTAIIEAFIRRLETEDWKLTSSSPAPGLKLHASSPWVAYAQCIEQHGVGEAYLPLLDMTGRMCREPGGEQLIEVLRQYAPTWLMHFPSLLSAADFEDLQKRALGTTQERMLREMAEVTEVMTTTRPLVMVLEDLHWCDSATLDFLAFLARRRGPARLLLIGTYRPANVANGSRPFGPLKQDLLLHRYCEEIVLPLLTEAEVATYLEMQFPPERRHGVPLHSFARCLHQRTDGNPLFLVNVVDYLIANSSAEKDETLESFEQLLQVVPANLQQMVEKQIERLSPEDQQMLEVASVAGVEFSAAALAAALESDVVAVEGRCRELVRCEQFLCERGIEEWPDATIATRYGFIHSLYHHVLYHRVTGARRARLHVQIGTRLEEGYGVQARENAVILASHFIHGRDYHRAVLYLQYAAENAVWRCALQEANAYLTKGVELLHHWPDTPERTQQELAFHLIVIGPLMASKGEASLEVEQVYEQIVKLHRRLGETETPFVALIGLWMVRLVRGELVIAQDIAAQIMKRAEQEHEPILQLLAQLVVGICAFYRGDFSLAHSHLVQALTLYETQEHPQYLLDPKMLSLSIDSLAVWMLGQPALAMMRSQNAIAWTRQLSHPYNSVAALTVATWLLTNRRDKDGAETQIAELLQTAQTHGFIQYTNIGIFLRGRAGVEHGHSEDGIRLMLQGIEAMRATKFGVGMSAWLGFLAAALGESNRIDQALATLAQAETVMENSGERFFEAELCRIKGEILLRQARLQSPESPSDNSQSTICNPQLEAEKCFLKAVAIARQQQAKSLELRAVMSLVRLQLQYGGGGVEYENNSQEVEMHSREYVTGNTKLRTTLAEDHQMLLDVYGWFTEGFETPDLQEARQLLAAVATESPLAQNKASTQKMQEESRNLHQEEGGLLGEGKTST